MTDKSELEANGQTYDWSTVTRPWVTSATEYGRRPPAEDREFRSFTATLPPRIASTPFSFGSKVERNLVDATLEIAALEASATADVTAISGFLLRTESQSSSKIERIYASRDDFARAMAGEDAPAAALEMARSAAAVTALIASGGGAASVTEDSLLAAHAALFDGNFLERTSAGRLPERCRTGSAEATSRRAAPTTFRRRRTRWSRS